MDRGKKIVLETTPRAGEARHGGPGRTPRQGTQRDYGRNAKFSERDACVSKTFLKTSQREHWVAVSWRGYLASSRLNPKGMLIVKLPYLIIFV